MTTKNIKNNDETAPLLSTADDYSFPLSPLDNDTYTLSPLGKDIMSLDTREGSEYDNLASSSLSFPCLTRESRNEESDFMSNDIMPTGYSGQSPNMTKGNNNLKMPEGNNNLKMPEGNNNSKGIKGNNGICVSIPCHSRALSRESRAKTAFMPQAFRFAEYGRSMAEMLGVLAVIGVLSIGGIMGYSYGMDKYRANELTNTGNAFLREPWGGTYQHRYKGNLFRAICQ